MYLLSPAFGPSLFLESITCFWGVVLIPATVGYVPRVPSAAPIHVEVFRLPVTGLCLSSAFLDEAPCRSLVLWPWGLVPNPGAAPLCKCREPPSLLCTTFRTRASRSPHLARKTSLRASMGMCLLSIARGLPLPDVPRDNALVIYRLLIAQGMPCRTGVGLLGPCLGGTSPRRERERERVQGSLQFFGTANRG